MAIFSFSSKNLPFFQGLFPQGSFLSSHLVPSSRAAQGAPQLAMSVLEVIHVHVCGTGASCYSVSTAAILPSADGQEWWRVPASGWAGSAWICAAAQLWAPPLPAGFLFRLWLSAAWSLWSSHLALLSKEQEAFQESAGVPGQAGVCLPLESRGRPSPCPEDPRAAGVLLEGWWGRRPAQVVLRTAL